MNKSKLISFISEGLYFRKISQFSDKTEGNFDHYGIRQRQAVKLINESNSLNIAIDDSTASNLTKKIMEDEKSQAFIQSWYHDHLMSTRMWEEYSGYKNEKDCAVIVVNEISLVSYLADLRSLKFDFKNVEYVTDKNKVDEPFFTKENNFSFEKELRLLIDLRFMILFNKNILREMRYFNKTRNTTISGLTLENYIDPVKFPASQFKYIDESGFIYQMPNLSNLVEAIMIPADASKEFEEEINSLLKINRYSITVKRVDIESTKNLRELIS